MTYDSDLLDNLSEEERKVALEILQQFSTDGKSKTFDNLLYQDYKEIPVDIITFIKDDKYLGRAWHTKDGKCKLFPYWEEKLQEIFPDNLTTNFNTFIESGARGLGKSEIAVTCALYLMHRLMCLKDPHTFLNLKPTEQVAFAFMNITEVLAMDIGVSKFQNTVQVSPWFMERGTISGKNNLIWNPPEFINIIIGSQPRHVIGQAIYFAFFDEISFIPNQDIEKQKQKAKDMIDTALGGMKTRFTNRGKNPTLLVLASSKRSDKSFLEEHMRKKIETDHENTIIVDEPVWNIRPASEYSGKRFNVAVGNKFLVSEVIPDGVDAKPYIDRGFNVISVPVEYKASFIEDMDRSLCDYAGISSTLLSKYISGERFQSIKNFNLKNPFKSDVIEVGNNNNTQYYDYFDLNKVDSKLKSRPMFIHLDMSLTGDKTGIAGIWIKGKKPHQAGMPETNELFYTVAFVVSIKAPKGYQISLEKNRNFIYWLKEQGFNIKGISSDTFQSADTGQQLAARGFSYEVISVDRVDTDRICKPYQYIKNTIYEERIETFDSELMTLEFLQLERNNNSGKVDHPDGQSKDMADAVTGAIFNASKHAEEFAFDYGETLDTIVDVSSSSDVLDKKQIQVAFEQELQSLLNPIAKRNQKIEEENSKKEDAKFIENKNTEPKKESKPDNKNITRKIDFGMGPAEVYKPSYLSQNIIWWE